MQYIVTFLRNIEIMHFKLVSECVNFDQLKFRQTTKTDFKFQFFKKSGSFIFYIYNCFSKTWSWKISVFQWKNAFSKP